MMQDPHLDPEYTDTVAYAHCPICEVVVRRRVSADFAPFLCLRCGISPSRPAFANFCELCEHLFFSPRLSDQELERLYTDYRGKEYLAQRLEAEPSYDVDHVYFEDDEAKVRAEYYSHFLSEFRNTTGTILDFGGGDGTATRWAFPDAELIVVDHDHEARGVDLVTLARRADFLLCAHVFEHVPDPVPLLSKLVSGLRDGTFIYLELPKEYPGRLADVFEQLEGQEAAGEPFNPVPQRRAHEHIAHFSKRSAQRLLIRAGARPIEVHQADTGIFGILAIADSALGSELPEPPRLKPRYPDLPIGRAIDFHSSPPLTRYLSYGWRKPEDTYVWSSGYRARVAIPLGLNDRAIRLNLLVNPLVNAALPAQRIEAWLGQAQVDKTSAACFTEAPILLPRGLNSDPFVELRFPDATTPQQLGLSTDRSLLAIQLLAITVQPLPTVGDGWFSTGTGGEGVAALLSGWRPPETGFSWSDGGAAVIAVDPGPQLPSQIVVKLDMTPLVRTERLEVQRLIFSIAGRVISQQTLAVRGIIEVPIPPALAPAGALRLRIDLPDATSPAALGLSDDPSVLAVQIHGLSIGLMGDKVVTKA